MEEIILTSPAFQHNKKIPEKYTADGENINPALEISNVPENAKSLVLVIEDPDASVGTWVHWVVFNIPATNSKIKENSIPGTPGLNDFKKTGYGGPSPPSGTHRYVFKIYALDIELDLGEGELFQNVEIAMADHILAEGKLIGIYSRN